MQQFPDPATRLHGVGAAPVHRPSARDVLPPWWLYVLPLVLFLALGVATVLGRGTTYRSSGVILVNRDSLLNQLTAIQAAEHVRLRHAPRPTRADSSTLCSAPTTFLQSVITKARA